MNPLRSFLPNRIGGQIAILIVISLFIFQAVLTTLFPFDRSGRPFEYSPDQIKTLVELIAARPADKRPALLSEIADAFPHLDMTLAPLPPAAGATPAIGQEFRLGPNYRVLNLERQSQDVADGQLIAIGLPDGQFITARVTPRRRPLLSPTSVSLVAIAICNTFLGLWAAWSLARPLRQLAVVAENFTLEGELTPAPERGPYEIRAAAHALNEMQGRIKGLTDNRTRMLAAVSHDLRTPIARLRLRCELIADEAARLKTLAELARMNSMVESVLHFLRDGKTRQQTTMIDLSSCLQTVCDLFTDVGYNVWYDGPDHVVVRADAGELHRAITNLIDNAVQHGSKANVRLALTGATVTVAIEDDGPGILLENKESMFEPFVRGDAARNTNSGAGFGLGLTIAKNIIEAHSGILTLHDREPHGLVAIVELPRADTKYALS